MKPGLRVAMIIQAYHPIIGGAEKQLGTIAPMLKARGVDVHILTRQYEGLVPFETIDGIPVHRLAIPGPMPVASLMFTLNGLNLLSQLKPDVIHAHELLSPTTTAVAAKLLFKSPVVAKVLGGGADGDISKLKRNLISSIRVNTILKGVDRFITISREIGSELETVGIPRERQAYIPNGVNTERFQPVDQAEKAELRGQLDLPRGGCVAIYTGRLDEEKNVGFLVSGWSQVRAATGAALVVVGTGSEQKAIRAMAGEGVILTGSQGDVAPYLKCADLFILPSKREGLSNALLEAMACGLPVVASRVGGNVELVRDGSNGFLFPSMDQSAMIAAIVRLASDAQVRAGMGKESREFIMEHFPIIKTIDRLIELYSSLLETRSAAA